MTAGFRRAALHLGGLWALAFVQPLLGLLGDQAEFFVARGSRPLDIVVLAVGYAFIPPLAGATLVWLAGLVRPELGAAVLVTLVGLLVAALVLPLSGDESDGTATPAVRRVEVRELREKSRAEKASHVEGKMPRAFTGSANLPATPAPRKAR